MFIDDSKLKTITNVLHISRLLSQLLKILQINTINKAIDLS